VLGKPKIWDGMGPHGPLLNVLHLKREWRCKLLILMEFHAAIPFEPAYKPAKKHAAGWHCMKLVQCVFQTETYSGILASGTPSSCLPPR